MVARRWIPLVVALAVAFAPAALEACQVSCRSHAAAHVDEMPAGHAHHHHAALSQPRHGGATVAAQPHSCTRTDDLVVISAVVSGHLVAPAIVASGVAIARIPARVSRLLYQARAPSSTPIALTTPLRV